MGIHWIRPGCTERRCTSGRRRRWRRCARRSGWGRRKCGKSVFSRGGSLFTISRPGLWSRALLDGIRRGLRPSCRTLRGFLVCLVILSSSFAPNVSSSSVAEWRVFEGMVSRWKMQRWGSWFQMLSQVIFRGQTSMYLKAMNLLNRNRPSHSANSFYTALELVHEPWKCIFDVKWLTALS